VVVALGAVAISVAEVGVTSRAVVIVVAIADVHVEVCLTEKALIRYSRERLCGERLAIRTRPARSDPSPPQTLFVPRVLLEVETCYW
jgi:hypothetical protein